ncbi:MAG: outer membrane protein assembly factor BamB [Gammaproteobacteria bacterium]|nr:outer membrane protein assembly factor BamB [Gammaproteobacteria bacterium]
MIRLNRLLCFLVLLTFVGGCSIFRGNRADKEPEAGDAAPLLEFTPEIEVERVWSKRIGKGLGRKYVQITPAIVDDRIFVSDAYGLVFALDRLTGDVIWRTQVGNPDRRSWLDISNRSDPSFVSGGIGVGTGKVFVGTVRGELIALNMDDGSEIWRETLSSEILAPAAATSDVVVVQTSDGKMYALESESGETRWTFDTQDPIVTLRGTASPVLSDGLAYAGFANGLLAAVELESGFPRWEQRLKIPEGTSELERINDVDGRPLILGQVVYAANHQGTVQARRRSDGFMLWEKPNPSFHALAEGLELVFVVTDDDLVVAAQQESGNEAWIQEAFKNRILTDPLAFHNYIVVGDDKGYLHVIAQRDGRPLGRYKIGSSIRSPMVEEDGVFYALTNKGHLEALRISRIE